MTTRETELLKKYIEMCKKMKTFPKNYKNIKNDYLAKLDQEIKENAISQKKAFVNCIVPAMQVEIDSLLEKDMGEVMNKYAGGIMNWRKLKFFFGTGSDSFEKIWKDKRRT